MVSMRKSHQWVDALCVTEGGKAKRIFLSEQATNVVIVLEEKEGKTVPYPCPKGRPQHWHMTSDRKTVKRRRERISDKSTRKAAKYS